MKKNFSIKKILDTCTGIADTYNFIPLHKFFKNKKIKKTKRIHVENKVVTQGVKKDITSILKAYIQADMHETKEPLLVYFSNADKYTRSDISSSKSEENYSFTLVVIGIKEAFGEALLLSSAHSIMEEITKENPLVYINSMGDNACSEKYIRELDLIIRKNISIDKISMKCINIFNKNGPIEACNLINQDDEFINIRNTMPSTIKFLNDSSRDHFQSVIEYLEAHETPYILSQELIDDPKETTHTIFKIISKRNENILASGKRIDKLSQHLFAVEIPVSFITITFDKKTKRNNSISRKNKNTSKVFFLHSGYKARLQTLPLLKIFRKNNIQVKHSVYHKRVADQLENSRKEDCNFVFILGQQEILEKTIRIRNMKNKSQEVIPIKKILNRLRRIQ